MKPVSVSLLNTALGVAMGLLIAGSLGFANEQKKEAKASSLYDLPQVPQQLSFAGEPVPLDRWDVKERLDRELLINHTNKGNLAFLIKSANRYFPVISERLKANGVPEDFKYLCIAESNLVPGAISSVGAASFWQFMSGTAPGYGLEVNSNVDRRYDLVKATDAACRYLKSAYEKFGTWTAAAASYNCGQGGYNAQASYQGTTNYYDLLLPEETNRYLFRILAFKHLLENAKELSLDVADADKYAPLPYRELTVTTSISNLASFAREQGTTYKMLRQMNPWLRGRSLPVGPGKSYLLKLPPEKGF